MTQNKAILVQDEKVDHWMHVTVGENKYQMEVQKHEEGVFNVLVFKGEKVVEGGRLATIDIDGHSCYVRTYFAPLTATEIEDIKAMISELDPSQAILNFNYDSTPIVKG